MHKIRGCDEQGCGHFGASRGHRKHKGIDLEADNGSIIKAFSSGKVTKIGFPYRQDDPKRKHFRYVQVTNSEGHDFRYFYISPVVELHEFVEKGEPLGMLQDLTRVYPDITPHFHFEVKVNNYLVDPHPYFDWYVSA